MEEHARSSHGAVLISRAEITATHKRRRAGTGDCILHGHAPGDGQLPLAGTRLHVEVSVIDEQHLQEVPGELGSPGHVQPRPQQLQGHRGSAVRALGVQGGDLHPPVVHCYW